MERRRAQHFLLNNFYIHIIKANMNIAPNNNSVQTEFKIILNTNDTSSWTGATKFNANFKLDLKQVLFSDISFDKSYRMTFQLRSTADATITSTKVYLASLLLSNGTTQTTIHQPAGTPMQTTGLLCSYYDQGAVAGYLSTNDSDNSPLYISNLRNITGVQVRITDHTYTTIAPTANYVLILHFQQIEGNDPYNMKKYVNNTLAYPGK
jgi:hypothetical protein